jgi:diguanylate cyclase (GGDEF)-like protein
VHPDDRKQAKAAWREAVHHGTLYNATYRIQRGGGEYLHFTVRAVPVRNADNSIREWLGICFDISEQKQQESKLAEAQARMVEALRAQAVRDPLTGLFNRYYLQETLPRECRQAQRRRTPLSVAMLDIDNFKLFNDEHGHQAGDKVLKELGKLLLTTVRTSDIVCRYGGEEFLLVLLDAELTVALTSLHRICHEIKLRRIVYRGQVLPSITLSAGIAQFPVHGTSTSDLLRAADQALYSAKGQGRDRIIISTNIPGDSRRRG